MESKEDEIPIDNQSAKKVKSSPPKKTRKRKADDEITTDVGGFTVIGDLNRSQSQIVS